MLDDENLELSEMMTFDGTPKAQMWSAPAVHIHEPKLKKGAFHALWGTEALVVDNDAFVQIADLLEMSGEILDLPHKGKPFYVANVTACFNVLDLGNTQWMYEKGRLPIRKYAFHATRLEEVPLFRIPESCRSEILTVEGTKDPDDEFKGRVERLGLKGLLFEQIWTDEK